MLDVLLTEYKMSLILKGYGRSEMAELCMKASNRLDTERENPTGKVGATKTFELELRSLTGPRCRCCGYDHGRCVPS